MSPFTASSCKGNEESQPKEGYSAGHSSAICHAATGILMNNAGTQIRSRLSRSLRVKHAVENPSFRHSLIGIARWHCSKSRTIIKNTRSHCSPTTFVGKLVGIQVWWRNMAATIWGVPYFVFFGLYVHWPMPITLPLALGPGGGRPCQGDHKRRQFLVDATWSFYTW